MNLSTGRFALAMLALAPAAAADLTLYTQDFEAMDPNNGSVLSADGWLVYGNVFDTLGNPPLYGYGPFPAPNGGPGFCSLDGGLGGAPQGAQYFNIYNDYNNADHANSLFVEANVYREWTVGAADVGATWTLAFDYLQNPTVTNGAGNTTTLAFIKVLRQSDGSYAELAFETLDTTGASSSAWASGSIDILIDPTFAGELLQIGFASTATDYNDSGRFYDNIVFDAPGAQPPGMADYSQDFETLAFGNPNALGDDGWNIFANIYDPVGGYLYGYGVFPAPNNAGGFSGLATGAGGAPQGTLYMDVFSDYNNTAEHTAGNLVEALVFQEQPIAPLDAGTTWTFNFDHLQNPTVTNGAGATTTRAFIKVIKVSDGSFATLLDTQLDTTGTSTTVWDNGTLTATINPTWVGEVIQFGFASIATNFDDSSRLYDNVSWTGDDSLGTPYCTVNPNSTGVGATLGASGSLVAADNDFTLDAANIPAFQFGFFLNSDTPGFLANIGVNGQGNLCLGGTIGRFNQPGQILNSGAGGAFSLPVDLTQIPRGLTTASVMSGETYYFQAWFRDTFGGQASSNLTNGLEVTFQ